MVTVDLGAESRLEGGPSSEEVKAQGKDGTSADGTDRKRTTSPLPNTQPSFLAKLPTVDDTSVQPSDMQVDSFRTPIAIPLDDPALVADCQGRFAAGNAEEGHDVQIGQMGSMLSTEGASMATDQKPKEASKGGGLRQTHRFTLVPRPVANSQGKKPTNGALSGSKSQRYHLAHKLRTVPSVFALTFLRDRFESLGSNGGKCGVCLKRLGQRRVLQCDDCRGQCGFWSISGVDGVS